MSAGQHYRAVFGFESTTGKDVLSFNAGEQFTLVSKTDENWWLVQCSNGEKGLAPIAYLEACPMRNGGPMQSAAYTTIYDYTASGNSQLSFTKGQRMFLVDKTDVSWWTMQTPEGRQGLVPVSYIDKLDLPKEEANSMPTTPTHVTEPPHPTHVTATARKSLNAFVSPLTSPGVPEEDEEGFHEVLASIDSNIARIHDEAAIQGGNYSSGQRAALQKLVLHRQSIVSSSKPPVLSPNHAHPVAPPPGPEPASQSSPLSSPTKKGLTQHQSPIPRRHAPPPPTSVNGSARTRIGSVDDRKRTGLSKAQRDNRYSLHNSSTDHEGRSNQSSGSLPRQHKSSSRHVEQNVEPNDTQSYQGEQYYSLQRPQSSGIRKTSSSSPPKSKPSLNSTPSSSSSSSSQLPRRKSESTEPAYSPTSPDKKSNPQNSPRAQGGSVGVASTPTGARNRLESAGQSKAYSSSAHSSPRNPNARGSSKERDVPSHKTTHTHHVPTVSLPTSFSPQDGTELVETVRQLAGITHRKAQQAVGGVLQFLKKRVPECEGMADGLFAALEQAMQQNSALSVSKKHSDLERLREIFFEITECKDDSQQRSWAVHEDEKAISDLLEEMLQILCDANPEVSKVAVVEDKYENVLTLITYYQMEARVPIRLLLLKVFGMLCGLDATVIGILLSSVLPNELARDMQQNLTELQKTLYSSTVCTMIFSSAEAVPLSIYDQWDVSYVLFLLDTIETPLAEDVEDQIPDVFLNVLLSFNQHFPDPATNLVMQALKQRPNPRNFSEKLMFLINRGEDPVAITTPCCPDSITKFLLDLFSDSSTSCLFYTTDMRVLIDIITRQLTDLCPGMEARTHYLELLHRMVGSTDYADHLHRRRDLVGCLNRIANEEAPEGQADRELVKKIWMTYPQVFEEITDL